MLGSSPILLYSIEEMRISHSVCVCVCVCVNLGRICTKALNYHQLGFVKYIWGIKKETVLLGFRCYVKSSWSDKPHIWIFDFFTSHLGCSIVLQRKRQSHADRRPHSPPGLQQPHMMPMPELTPLKQRFLTCFISWHIH